MADLLFSTDPIQALQQFASPLLDGFFLVITQTGTVLFLLTASLLVYWLWDKRVGFLLASGVAVSASLNAMLKAAFDMPRPPESLWRTDASGPGFPSGHAQESSAFWSLAGVRVRGIATWLSVLAIATVAISRVYLGVHFVGDVLGGAAFGAAVAVVTILGSRFRFLSQSPIRERLLMSLLVPTAAQVVLFLAAHRVSADLGVLTGLAVGYVLEGARVRMAPARGRTSIAVRAVGGGVAFVGAYLIGTRLGSAVLSYPFHAALGLLGTLALPWAFVRLERSLGSMGKGKPSS